MYIYIYIYFIIFFFHLLAENAPKITREINIQEKANSMELMVGAAPVFVIEAQGTRPLQYVWSQDGVVIQNSTQPYLTITSIQISQSGIYRCLVYNSLGATQSLPFSLIVKGEFVHTGFKPAQQYILALK